MGIYLGCAGAIELTRKSPEGLKYSTINPDDVNPSKKRFSFDFEDGTLITGDLLEISTTNGSNLDFIDSSAWLNATVQSSGNWYVFIDDLGGIRLYSNFSDSLRGSMVSAISINAIASDIPISVAVRERDSRILGSVSSYELNTNRETIDISVLGDEYRQQYSGMITGNGSLTAFWDYGPDGDVESIQYLMHLVLRTEIGSSFRGKFYIKSENSDSQTTDQFGAKNDSLWWEFDAIVTASVLNFTPDNLITGTINFIATGPIKLRSRTSAENRLLKEDGDGILLEQDSNSYILLENLE
jgi:hypothetical protein